MVEAAATATTDFPLVERSEGADAAAGRSAAGTTARPLLAPPADVTPATPVPTDVTRSSGSVSDTGGRILAIGAAAAPTIIVVDTGSSS